MPVRLAAQGALGPVRPPAQDARIALGDGLVVNFVSVGQGDAEYIELPGGRNALIDGGPTEQAIQQFLSARGVSKIDYVVLTHPHADHYTGLNYVFSSLPVSNFYDTRMNNSSATGDEKVRAKAAGQPGCTLHYPAPDENLDWAANVQVKVLNSCPDPVASKPGAAPIGAGNEVNNCSIVLKLSYQGHTVLFMGDAESEVEDRLVEKYGDALGAEIIKVGHHGSRYSSSAGFLARVHPQKAYVEVGKNNYGHPAADSLARLQAAGAAVYRTDQDGTMSYAIGTPGAPSGDVLTASSAKLFENRVAGVVSLSAADWQNQPAWHALAAMAAAPQPRAAR